MNRLSCRELQEKCRELGLKAYGTKAQMVERINKELEVSDIENIESLMLNPDNADHDPALILEASSDDDEDTIKDVPIRRDSNESNAEDESLETIDGDDGNNKMKRKRIIAPYKKLQEFHNKDDAIYHLMTTFDTWKFFRRRDTIEGIKDCYVCKNKNCKKKCYILHTDEVETVTLWVNEHEHEHEKENIEKDWGINSQTKIEIEKLFKSQVTGASKIIYALRDMTVKDSVTYVEGIVEPTPAQVNNFINNNVKKKIIKPNFSYGDLASYVDNNKEVPEDEHEPFVIDSLIEVNDKVPSSSRVVISTKYLIGLARKTNHICADTTWKLNWQSKLLPVDY